MDDQSLVPQPSSSYQPPAKSFSERIMGALRLDRPTFDEVRRDPSAMTQAAIVIALAGLASGAGAFFGSNEQSFTIDDRTYTLSGGIVTGVVAGLANVVISLIVWVFLSIVYRFVAIRMLGSSEENIQWQEVGRPIAFASAPGLLSFLTPIPILGPLASFIGGIWAFAAQIVALSETFRISKWRAFGVVVGSVIVLTVVFGVLACVCVLVALAIF
ncbi:MAG: YIP1 family protein [Thermomicrobiales bacterium]|nr:YIP1 family protein [Thermomicrobiales bacterium]MCO5223082.1 YIP1 family protein [Thermomicrobiales bacterium]